MMDKIERYNIMLKMRRKKITWKKIGKFVGLTEQGAWRAFKDKPSIPRWREFSRKINILYDGRSKTLITRY